MAAMSHPISGGAHHVDEPEVLGFEPSLPIWRRPLRSAAGVLAAGGLACGLLAVGALVAVSLGIFLLLFAAVALLAGRVRVVIRR